MTANGGSVQREMWELKASEGAPWGDGMAGVVRGVRLVPACLGVGTMTGHQPGAADVATSVEKIDLLGFRRVSLRNGGFGRKQGEMRRSAAGEDCESNCNCPI